MPFYEYICPEEHKTTKMISFSEYTEKYEGKEIDCDVCGEPSKRNYKDQNVLGLMDTPTRGGKWEVLKHYGGGK